MHMRGNQMKLNSVNPYSAAAEKAIAAQRAAGVRKKLKKTTRTAKGNSGTDVAFMVGKWMGSGKTEAQNGDGYCAA
jgi:hypothetical protein